MISGWTDVSKFANKWGIPFLFVERYDLKSKIDQDSILNLKPELIWVAGWQRLVPKWLINCSKFGVLGSHGSPDGINGGRGRSPQNWALMLGCKRFDVSLFCISEGIDDGPIIIEDSFFYNNYDDIGISYKKYSLCMSQLVIKVLNNPSLIKNTKPQKGKTFFYPQRKPEDGFVDWNLNSNEIWSHCRSLGKPYPGLRTLTEKEQELIIWDCQPFDNKLLKETGIVDFIFEDNSFLVSCGDGRLIIKKYEVPADFKFQLKIGEKFKSLSFANTLRKIIERHNSRYSEMKISQRIYNKLNSIENNI